MKTSRTNNSTDLIGTFKNISHLIKVIGFTKSIDCEIAASEILLESISNTTELYKNKHILYSFSKLETENEDNVELEINYKFIIKQVDGTFFQLKTIQLQFQSWMNSYLQFKIMSQLF